MTPTRPTLPTLSPEALAALKLPLTARGDMALDADGNWVLICYCISPRWRAEIAAFIAALLNAALTPAVTVEPESNVELRQADDDEPEASNPELRAQVAYYDWTNDGEAVLRQAVSQ